MRVLHATDIRHIPLIVRYGLFAGARSSACVPDDSRGRAYVERLVSEQARRGCPMAVLVFEVPAAEVTPADDPYGVGLALTQRAPGLPPRLLGRIEAVEPQGRRVASAFREWERGHGLCWLDPARLDRQATLDLNRDLQDRGILPQGNLDSTSRALADRAMPRLLPPAIVSCGTVLGLVAAYLLFAGGHGDPVKREPAGTAALYRQHCAGCHGESGRGDGLQARVTLLKIPDWTQAPRLAGLNDEYLYTVIAKGSAALGGTSAMPGWDHVLKPEEIRALVAYTRALSQPPSRPR
jgi:mono/diheme cytochrome c family protein